MRCSGFSCTSWNLVTRCPSGPRMWNVNGLVPVTTNEYPPAVEDRPPTGALASRTTAAPSRTTASATPAARLGKRIPGLVDRGPYLVERHHAVALDGHLAGVEVDPDVADPGQPDQLVGHRLHAVPAGHSADGVGLANSHQAPFRIGRGGRSP